MDTTIRLKYLKKFIILGFICYFNFLVGVYNSSIRIFDTKYCTVETTNEIKEIKYKCNKIALQKRTCCVDNIPDLRMLRLYTTQPVRRGAHEMHCTLFL
jgi:hypothetical protein